MAFLSSGFNYADNTVVKSCTFVLFAESCEPITFPCSNKPNGGYYAVPDNCEFSFRCVHQSVRKCKSPTNTGFDIDADRFIHRFDANCTCPNGFKLKTASTTTVLAPSEL